MRITNNMMIKNMMRNLNSNLRRMDKVQQRMSSGKKFQLPSDDPIGVSKSLKLHTDISKIEQYKRNLDDARSWLDVTEDALEHLGGVLHRARELTVQAANGSNSDEDLSQIIPEIKQLKEQIVKIANTTYAGRSIFTGFKTDEKLLDDDGNYLINLGQDEISKYNIGVSEDIEVNTVGVKVFGIDNIGSPDYDSDAAGGDKSYIFSILQNLEDKMNGINTDPIDESLVEIDNALENVLSIRAEIGAKSNRLEITSNRLDSAALNFEELLSDNEDVDMAEVIMDLKIEENVYRASLSAGARIIQPTLVDFLR